MTAYMILSRNGEQTSEWTERGVHEANSERAAKLKAISDEWIGDDDTVELAAVPMRSWHPETATREVQTKMVWGTE